MSEDKICPVVKAIREIRGAGLCDDDDTQTVKLGGSDAQIEYVCDDVSFYITTRKMTLARFELSRPTMQECVHKYHELFRADYTDYAAIYAHIVEHALEKKYMYRQFVQLVDLLENINQPILRRVDNLARQGKPVNISLPDIIFLPHVDQIIAYRPDILEHTINKIIDYVNRINIDSLIPSHARANIKHVGPFTAAEQLDMSISIEPIDATTPAEYMEQMNALLNHEITVAKYVNGIEKYQCMVINHMNKIYDFCKKIMTELD